MGEHTIKLHSIQISAKKKKTKQQKEQKKGKRKRKHKKRRNTVKSPQAMTVQCLLTAVIKSHFLCLFNKKTFFYHYFLVLYILLFLYSILLLLYAFLSFSTLFL